MTSTDRLARDLRRLERDVHALGTKPRLSRSAIDGGALELRDIEGNTTGYVGEQFDGTFTVAPVGGSYPSAPTQPLVTPVQGGLRLYWDGTYEDGSVTRMDFRRVTFHAVALVDGLDALDILSPAQIVGEITIATGGEIICSLPPGVEHLVVAVTWTDAGKFSPESEPGFGTPLLLSDAEEWLAHEEALKQLNEVTLPGLEADLQASNDTLTTRLAELEDQVVQIETDTGTTSDLVTLINNSTRLRHGIY